MVSQSDNFDLLLIWIIITFIFKIIKPDSKKSMKPWGDPSVFMAQSYKGT